MQNEDFEFYTLPFAFQREKVSSTIQQWVWGATPSGFKRLRPDGTRMIVVREGIESCLLKEDFMGESDPRTEVSPFHGRGQLHFLQLENGERALVRVYRHGGVLRRITGDFFFTWPPRPFRELAVTEEARHRGVPTLEVLAACVRRAWGPFYRGWLITRELTGADDLWAALQSERYVGAAREPLLKSVAGSIKRMHRRGVVHRDLNLKNILVRREADELRSYIIDFDKAKFFPEAVSSWMVDRNLSRLLRSVSKFDPDGRRVTPEDWKLFLRFYREA